MGKKCEMVENSGGIYMKTLYLLNFRSLGSEARGPQGAEIDLSMKTSHAN